MLTKLLLTAAVIFGCYLFIRYKRGTLLEQQPQPSRVESSSPQRKSINWLALSLMAVLVVAAIGFFVHDYQDSQTLLDVKVVNPATGDEMRYKVYKGDLGARSFETIQGQQIRLGNSERMEVRESH